MSEEIMHNLDTCEVSAQGDELDNEHESLDVDLGQVQQRGLEMTSSNLGLVITGWSCLAKLCYANFRNLLIVFQPLKPVSPQ